MSASVKTYYQKQLRWIFGTEIQLRRLIKHLDDWPTAQNDGGQDAGIQRIRKLFDPVRQTVM